MVLSGAGMRQGNLRYPELPHTALELVGRLAADACMEHVPVQS